MQQDKSNEAKDTFKQTQRSLNDNARKRLTAELASRAIHQAKPRRKQVHKMKDDAADAMVDALKSQEDDAKGISEDRAILGQLDEDPKKERGALAKKYVIDVEDLSRRRRRHQHRIVLQLSLPATKKPSKRRRHHIQLSSELR
ncbi:hypothetical protein IWW38_003795 [Coemansia aciculifera]|uniref:Uncharacterized protein n=1 Tax=Coemansia aciculifera TaxID=417176 RepID=A0ACC1M048_9FUNG|nr:hypothetical protein IWW38_003795 [Coemansia aciculifera]